MSVLVDMSTGCFVEFGCFGNLAEYVHSLDCMEVEHNYRIFLDAEEAYAEVS